MSSLKDKVTSITKAFGLTSKGSLRQDVDELCKATDVTFTTMKETVDALSCVCEFANEVVPKLCEDAGVDATGKLGDDVATLKTEIGVEATKFPLALKELAESMGVDVKPDKLQKLMQLPCCKEAAKKPAEKQIDAPCVCAKGVEECRNCKAKEHPCVCLSLLLKAVDQPVALCKATKHACLCSSRFDGKYSYDPGHGAQGTYNNDVRTQGYGTYCLAPWTLTSQGAPHLCRQHNDDDVIEIDDDDEFDVKPKKKKSRKG
jgi:hypothetical protein